MAGRAESLRAFAEQFRTLAVDFSLPTEKRLALATTLLQQAIANGAFNGPEWLILRSLVEVGGQGDARLAGSFRDLVDWLASHGDKFEILSGFDWPRGNEILLMNPLAATFWHLAVIMERFAESEGMQDTPPDEAQAFDTAKMATHSPDFRSVNWYGTPHEFKPMQAACVKVLWEAWQNGTSAVGDATVLELAQSDSERLPLVFRDHAAWGTMIVDGQTKGTHRLADPPEA